MLDDQLIFFYVKTLKIGIANIWTLNVWNLFSWLEKKLIIGLG